MRHTFIPLKYRPKPESASLENKLRKPTFDFSNTFYAEGDQQVLCIGPRNDKVLELLDKYLSLEDKIPFFYLEDIWERWSFFSRDGEIRFVLHDPIHGNIAINPKLIYYRAPIIEADDSRAQCIQALQYLLNELSPKVLCNPLQHDANNAKLYQLSHHIRNACQPQSEDFSFPTSYVIKGKHALSKLPEKHLVAKSLSSVRTDVLDEGTFKNWPRNNLIFLPSLFQEIVKGKDIRVHCFKNYLSAKEIPASKNKNYRYHADIKKIQTHPISLNLEKFCSTLSKNENNPLLGIDFILEKSGRYYCLEANPGPGWSAFHYTDSPKKNSFLANFLTELTHVKS